MSLLTFDRNSDPISRGNPVELQSHSRLRCPMSGGVSARDFLEAVVLDPSETFVSFSFFFFFFFHNRVPMFPCLVVEVWFEGYTQTIPRSMTRTNFPSNPRMAARDSGSASSHSWYRIMVISACCDEKYSDPMSSMTSRKKLTA